MPNYIVFTLFARLCRFSFIAIAKHNLRHQRAATHAKHLLFAAGTGTPHLIPESLEGLTVPCVLNGGFLVQLYLVLLPLIEGAGHHHQIRAYVAAIAAALSGVQEFRQDALAEVQRTGDIAGVHTHFEGVLVHLGEELRYTGIVEIQHIGL